MNNGKRVLRWVFSLLVLICFAVTALVGGVFFTNYQNVGQLLQVGALIKSEFLWPVQTGKMIEGAIAGMVDSLGDEYSVYMNAEKFQELQAHIQGAFGGIGIYVGLRENKITVIAPIEGTPGAKVGIKSGDVIVKINDKATENMDIDEAVGIMKGEPGTDVKVTIERSGAEKMLDFEITREIINVPTVEGQILEENPDIAYLRIAMFASNTDEALAEELQKLTDQGFKAMIIDLRDNPGGDLHTVVNIAGHFIPEGPVVHIVNNDDKTETLPARGNNIKVPLVVLINGGSASASEILAGAVKDTGVGTLVGTKTFGKGIVQSIFFLNKDAGLKLTTAKYLTPNKNDIHEKGIEPDILVELPEYTPEQKEPLKDTQKEKAIEILEQQINNKG
ncbi:MAG: peptidase S41 [Peptococcaceae bacterium BICA1-8]|nr:MAG: peptidase S41 [Peptococcaceae bacterium BICA1-8]